MRYPEVCRGAFNRCPALMKRVLFIQNGEFDPPGLLHTALNAQGVTLDFIHAWNGERMPESPNSWDAIAIGGGAMSAYQKGEFPYLQDEEALIIAARDAGRPVLGICLGAQLMASAFGGQVFPNHAKEIGFYDVRFTPQAERDLLWRGHTETFQPIHWHGDTFTLPPDATLLASSDLTPNQLFRVNENLYGFQFHLEIDEPLLVQMIESDDEGGLPKNGVNPQRFLQEARLALPKVKPLADAVFKRWAEVFV